MGEGQPSMGSSPSPRTEANVKYLDDDEIKQFVDDLDHNGDGFISYAEVEQKLDQAHDDLVAKPGKHHVVQRDHDNCDDRARHTFLRGIMGGADRIPRDEFTRAVREWKIPSLKQSKKEEQDEKSYFKRLPGWRKVRAYMAVHGPEFGFIGLVVSMQLAFGIWQLVRYQTTPQYRAAFGWGVVMAKTCAGALYPTLFFLILSMSRYVSTYLRRSYHLSRFFNWDLSQKFHVRISCVTILLATLHAIGHLTGSFVSGSNPSNQDAVAVLLGPDAVPRPYINYVRSTPGFTGITALGLFYVLSLLSIPQVRRWNYEVFQLGHLLMYPIVGLLMAHGSAQLLQWTMLPYFLAVPTLFVLIERVTRIALGFHHIKAILKVLDNETVEITAVIPSERLWKYKAGQYIFLQVPQISFFQWHPFTISFCRGNKMMVHIKTDGNWTGKLRDLGGESGESEIKVGINGPFGAPAQRFYDFNHSVVIGSGIGVTPFSGILADLQYKDDLDHGSAHGHEKNLPAREKVPGAVDEDNGPVPRHQPLSSDPSLETTKPDPHRAHSFAEDYRRVDFHWIVRDRNYLLWLADLLNDVSRSQEWHRQNDDQPHLDIHINTHVTAKKKDIVTHVYRWLLELHRTKEHPASPLTGLLNPTHFGRPDFDKILDEHYEEMLRFQASKRRRMEDELNAQGSDDAEHSSVSSIYDEELKIGVFYCGAPVVGEILSDKCRELTIRGRHDGSKIEYHFMIEVFG
ncbi:hypothetical protein S40285_06822 [Stachybotrys chlorohalonatus IBT 40285]|uniref:EF-hand domain-containing protein n=1 Tax=Stachybotrys chlorohalonatus (strain IBT 40285) TaxID=1283841 RepID=A0A084QS84_STAC4|nr:hypothetical protein S40285_06822 [Stachybotrys chlorohalonata IBT 40285]